MVDSKKAANGQESGLIAQRCKGWAELVKSITVHKPFALLKLKWGFQYLKNGRFCLGVSFIKRGLFDLMKEGKR